MESRTKSKVYRSYIDIHDDDLASRVDLIRSMTIRREELSLSIIGLSRLMGHGSAGVHWRTEHKTNWPVHTIQLVARTMDCRVVFGLENFPDSPLSVEGSVLSMIKVRSARMADELHAAETKDSLVTLRRTLGVTGAAVADLCGISFKAVSHWECGSNAPYVNTLQRYARALGMLSGNGGYLSLSLADGWR